MQGKERLVVRAKNRISHAEWILYLYLSYIIILFYIISHRESDIERDLRNKDIYVFLCVRLLLNISLKT